MSALYGVNMNMGVFWSFLIASIAIAAVICVYVIVLPEKNYAKLPGFFKWLADFFNGKKLWLETTLKFIYIAVTIFYIASASISALYLLFTGYPKGFFAMLLGGVVSVVVVRLIYEGISLGILLVKNVIQINNRLRDKDMKDTGKENNFQGFNQ